jgi:hypothetical protein
VSQWKVLLDVSVKLLKPQLHLLENNFSLPTLR